MWVQGETKAGSPCAILEAIKNEGGKFAAL
jgi:hypothetical protein